ncbi:hypothetical protein GQ44DRAFT_778190 [Phaeosphaeriaceae sp. PMI808]|nr:hypothetical protein GQ44DRAFT_778190 [Phaeosphaeriaceae sp. PMI808]
MASKTKQAPARASPAINGMASLSDSLRMAENLKASITFFSSDNGFHALSQLTDQIPQLEKDIKGRDDRIKELTAQLDTERKHHVAEQRSGLENYNRKYDEYNDEKAALKRRIDGLQTSIQEKDTATTALQNELENYKTIGRELETKFKAKIAKLKEKEQEIENLRAELQKVRTSADDSSKKLSESRSRVVKLEGSLKESKNRHDSLKTEFDETNGRLNELLSFSAPLDDLDLGTVANGLENLWRSATLVVGKFLRQDLPNDMLQNDWGGPHDATILKLQIPLPQSNSEVAKEMRIATALGIFARLVNKYIFQPTYILEDGDELRGLLRRQAAVDDKKESFARGMFLSMFPEEQESESAAETRRQWVIGGLIGNVVHFLASDAVGMFREELENVLVQAQKTWRTIQYSKQRLEPSFRYTPDTNFGWQTFECQVANIREREQPVSPTTADDPEDELFVIFPRIYIVKSKQPITAGIVLRRARIRAAAQEVRENVSQTPFAEPASTRHRHRRSRDMSMSSEGAQGGPSAKPFLFKPVPWI